MVQSIENNLSKHLSRMHKGSPQLPGMYNLAYDECLNQSMSRMLNKVFVFPVSSRTVSGTLDAILKFQGGSLKGVQTDAINLVVAEIVKSCRSTWLVKEQAPLNPTANIPDRLDTEFRRPVTSAATNEYWFSKYR